MTNLATTELAIQIAGLSKQYRIGAAEQRAPNVLSVITRSFTDPFTRMRGVLRGYGAGGRKVADTMWALRDVSFDVHRGEVVGIIGRNGAGKSTLLKILSRITEPTEGYVDVYGRVGALLEVGTGFHVELTGRENIYLNASILGMRREEINRKFDEIVAFAEIEKFIDTPVKHYSSGMGVRLGFAVAAHIEPEVLIVDEVLSVGDASFQRKCLGKMSAVAGEGRTVLFVSHDMEAVQRLCSRVVMLEGGRVIEDGDTGRVISNYLQTQREGLNAQYVSPIQPDQRVTLLAASILGHDHTPTQSILFGEPFTVETTWFNNMVLPESVSYSIRLYDERDRLVTEVESLNTDLAPISEGEHTVRCGITNNYLAPGDYRAAVGCFVRPHTKLHNIDNCLRFTISEVSHDAGFAYTSNKKPAVQLPAVWEETAVSPVPVLSSVTPTV